MTANILKAADYLLFFPERAGMSAAGFPEQFPRLREKLLCRGEDLRKTDHSIPIWPLFPLRHRSFCISILYHLCFTQLFFPGFYKTLHFIFCILPRFSLCPLILVFRNLNINCLFFFLNLNTSDLPDISYQTFCIQPSQSQFLKIFRRTA